jgi:WD40 repeat protein
LTAYNNRDKSIKLWNLDTGTVIRNYEPATSQITSVSFSPDSTSLESGLLLSTSFDGTIYIHDSRSSSPVQKLAVPTGMPKWALSACWGQYVLVTIGTAKSTAGDVTGRLMSMT